jgi:tetratricopeptide (TPR) repeat protein
MKKFITVCLSAAFTVASLNAQIETPQPSPLGTVSQKVGLNEFSITYSRPSLKGRKAYGDVVPFDKLWRFGANMATTFKSNDEFSIQGNKVPAGEYSLFAIPAASEWTMILNKTAKMSGTSNYKESEDQIRFKVKPETLPYKTETFTIQFANLSDNKATVEILWDNLKASFEVNVDFDAKVMKQIDETLSGPTAGSYYRAASYYFKNNKDMKKALEWVNKSIEKGGEKYWIVSLKAEIQAANNDFKGAVETANRAIELAKADEDDAYIKKNTEHIAEWTPKMGSQKPQKNKKP